MALQFQVIPLNFGDGGVETKTDKKMVVPGKLTTLENGVFTYGKQIAKRYGYDKLGEEIIDGGSSIGASEALGNFNPSPGIDELIQIGGNKLYSYSPDQSKWIEKDDCYSLSLKYKSIYRNQNDVLNGDAATNSGIELYAWNDATTGQAGAVTVDSNTGAQIALEESLGSMHGRVRCASIGDYLYLFYIKSSGALVWRRVDISSPQTFSAETTIGGASTTSSALDVVSADGFLWVCYYSSGNEIEILKLTSAGAVSDTGTISETIDTNVLTICVNTNVFVYWHNSADGLCYSVMDSSLSSVLAKTVIDSDITDSFSPGTAIDDSATQQTFFYARQPAGSTTSLTASQAVTYSAVVNTSGIVSASTVLVRSVRPASKAFKIDSVAYFWAGHFSNLQSTLFLLRHDGLCVGKAFSGKTRGAGGYSLPSVVAKSATEVFHPQAVITKYDAIGGFLSVKSGISTVTVDFADVNSFQNRMLGSNLHTSGGFLSIYDGREVVESGFHLFPEDVSATPDTSGGSMADGTYLYAVVYEWVDNMGQVHRSAPSTLLTTVVSGGSGSGKVTLTIPTLRLTAKTEIAIQIYRTEADQTVLFNVKSPTGAILYNDPTVDSVTYEDTASDSSIETNELLYTTGGILENIAPESNTLIDVYQNRMVIAGMEDENEFEYSKVQVKGEGVAFSDVFKTRLSPDGGGISAVKLMDDKIILFKKNLIYYVSGEGPNDAGVQNNYTLPQLVTSDSGCPFPKSTVLTPFGIMYKSNKGIYLLNRALQVEFIGADVFEYNSQDITSADLVQDENQVRFLTSSGLTLLYDYYAKQWSTFTNHEGNDALIWKGVYTYLRTDGQVYTQATTFQDDAVNQYLKSVTAWIKMAGIQGFQRIRKLAILGQYKSAHSLRVRVYYDYDDTDYDEYTFDATTVIASTAAPYEFAIHLKRQKCVALKVEIQDTSAGAIAEAYNISDISFEIGLKKGVSKLKAAQNI